MTAEGNATKGPFFRTLHGRTQSAHFTGKFMRNQPVLKPGCFTAVEGDQEGGTTGTAPHAGIQWGQSGTI
jgi:hypothetical protein